MRPQHGGARVVVKNRLFENERVDVLSPGVPARTDRIRRIVEDDGRRRSPAQPGSQVIVYLEKPPEKLDLIRCPDPVAEGSRP